MAWLVGSVCAQTSPRDAVGTLSSSLCSSREGQSQPEVNQGPYQGFTIPAAFASSSWGKPQSGVG